MSQSIIPRLLMVIKSFVFMALTIYGFVVHAKLQIPSGLSAEDRKVLLSVLGPGAASRLIGDPYPLGGYSGVEVGISSEILSTAEIARLGSRASSQSEFSQQNLILGKGLFHRLDVFAQMSIPSQTEDFSYFGGQLRWGFFEGEYLPVYSSLILSAGSANFGNLVIANTQAADIALGFSSEDICLYVGGGQIRTQGRFVGGSSGITDTGETFVESSVEPHYMAGMSIRFEPMFLAFQLDRYSQSTYSAKIGARF